MVKPEKEKNGKTRIETTRGTNLQEEIITLLDRTKDLKWFDENTGKIVK